MSADSWTSSAGSFHSCEGVSPVATGESGRRRHRRRVRRSDSGRASPSAKDSPKGSKKASPSSSRPRSPVPEAKGKEAAAEPKGKEEALPTVAPPAAPPVGAAVSRRKAADISGYRMDYERSILPVPAAPWSGSQPPVTGFNFLPDVQRVYTPAQFLALGEMRSRVNDADRAGLTDADLCRFLRARKFNVNEALKLCEDVAAWRRKFHADTIDDVPDPAEEFFMATCANNFHKWDKLGRPIWFQRSGLCRPAKFLTKLTRADFYMRHIRHLERLGEVLDEASVRAGRVVDMHVFVMDLKGLSFKPDGGAMNLLKDMFALEQHYYPERLGRMFIINAPWIFHPIWAIVKRWLDPGTRDKIHLYGGDYSKALLEYIDKEDLPAEYGGTCACGREGGCVMSHDEARLDRIMAAFDRSAIVPDCDRVVPGVDLFAKE